MKVLVEESQYKLLLENLKFEEVYKNTYPGVFKFVCLKLAKNDYDLAKEYCQTGYIRVYQKLDTFKGESQIQAWVSRVVTNEIFNMLRKKVRSIDTNKDVEVEKLGIIDTETPKEDEIEYMGRFSKKTIHKAIDSLSDGYKFVFYNYFFEDKSHKEIADMLGISEGTSRSQLFKAKEQIKKYLEKRKNVG